MRFNNISFLLCCVFIITYLIIAFFGFRYYLLPYQLKQEITTMKQHEEALAQECLNLRYQIDVLTQMVKK